MQRSFLKMAATVQWLRTLFRLQKTILILLFISFLCGMVLGVSLVTNTDLSSGIFSLLKAEKTGPFHQQGNSDEKPHAIGKKDSRNPHDDVKALLLAKLQHNRNSAQGIIKSHVGNVFRMEKEGMAKRSASSSRPLLKIPVARHLGVKDTKDDTVFNRDGLPEPNYNVHVFYYPWYGTPEKDKGKWLHWNHVQVAHWDKNEAKKWPTGRHKPPEDIGSNFYPALGPYSSRDPAVMENHMKQLRSAGIGVLAVSWYPPSNADEQGEPWDDFLPQLFDIANKHQLKVCFHIEPYKNRNHENLRHNLQYIMDKYGRHPAFYRYRFRGRSLPLYYVYDSYLTKREDWATILRADGLQTVRQTDIDGLFIGLVVDEKQKHELMSAGFDGFYTYFASDGFTYGSSTRNWASLAAYAASSDALFIPSIGPGYVDVRIRPWNGRNTKEREHGGYYEQSFKAAVAAKPPIISITSFNEWSEGTQIEEAVPKQVTDLTYLDYSPQPSNYYLMLTQKWVHRFKKRQVA